MPGDGHSQVYKVAGISASCWSNITPMANVRKPQCIILISRLKHAPPWSQPVESEKHTWIPLPNPGNAGW